MEQTESGKYKLTQEEMAEFKKQHDRAIAREREAKYTVSQLGIAMSTMREALNSVRGNIGKISNLVAEFEQVIENAGRE